MVTAVVVYFFTLYAMKSFIITMEGWNPNIWFFSLIIYTSVIFVS